MPTKLATSFVALASFAFAATAETTTTTAVGTSHHYDYHYDPHHDYDHWDNWDHHWDSYNNYDWQADNHHGYNYDSHDDWHMEIPYERTPIFGFKIAPAGNVKSKTCATNTNNCERGNRKLWAVHNFIMWFLWVALMALIVCSVRYFRHYWRKLIYVHVVAGLLIFFGMTAAVAMAWVRNA